MTAAPGFKPLGDRSSAGLFQQRHLLRMIRVNPILVRTVRAHRNHADSSTRADHDGRAGTCRTATHVHSDAGGGLAGGLAWRVRRSGTRSVGLIIDGRPDVERSADQIDRLTVIESAHRARRAARLHQVERRPLLAADFGVHTTAAQLSRCAPQPRYSDLRISAQAIAHGCTLPTLNCTHVAPGRAHPPAHPTRHPRSAAIGISARLT